MFLRAAALPVSLRCMTSNRVDPRVSKWVHIVSYGPSLLKGLFYQSGQQWTWTGLPSSSPQHLSSLPRWITLNSGLGNTPQLCKSHKIQKIWQNMQNSHFSLTSTAASIAAASVPSAALVSFFSQVSNFGNSNRFWCFWFWLQLKLPIQMFPCYGPSTGLCK